MILIPVSAHVKKYTDSRFGTTIRLDDRTSFHIILKLTLFTWQSEFNFPDTKKEKILPNHIIIESIYYYKKLPAEKIEIVSWLFEALFMEELYTYVLTNAHKKSKEKTRPNTLRCIEDFCNKHGIELEQDVSQDALIKAFYRYAKKQPVQSPSFCPFIHMSEKPNLLSVAVA